MTSRSNTPSSFAGRTDTSKRSTSTGNRHRQQRLLAGKARRSLLQERLDPFLLVASLVNRTHDVGLELDGIAERHLHSRINGLLRELKAERRTARVGPHH